MRGCVDTQSGTIHRFPDPDAPCQCGAVVKNRRSVERVVETFRKPTGSKSAPVYALIKARGGMTVSQLADELKQEHYAVQQAIAKLSRSHKVMRIGTTTAIDARGYTRSVAIYGVPLEAAYPTDSHAS